jgi:hypothetical protein
MDKTKLLDYLFIGLITAALAFVMGLCIVSVIDKKITDISVNIPEIKCGVCPHLIKDSDVEHFSSCSNNIKEETPIVTNDEDQTFKSSFTGCVNKNKLDAPWKKETIPVKDIPAEEYKNYGYTSKILWNDYLNECKHKQFEDNFKNDYDSKKDYDGLRNAKFMKYKIAYEPSLENNEVVEAFKNIKKKRLIEGFTDSSEIKNGVVDTQAVPKKIVDLRPPRKNVTFIKKKSSIPAVNDYLDQFEHHDEAEGYKYYAVAGCPDRRKKLNLYPDLVSCAQPNYLTAENYYEKNFNYPYIPGQSEERWMGADYERGVGPLYGKHGDYMSELGNPYVSRRIIVRNASKKLPNKPPFPYNYWFRTTGESGSAEKK